MTNIASNITTYDFIYNIVHKNSKKSTARALRPVSHLQSTWKIDSHMNPSALTRYKIMFRRNGFMALKPHPFRIEYEKIAWFSRIFFQDYPRPVIFQDFSRKNPELSRSVGTLYR